MSEGNRLPLEDAQAAAAFIMLMWGLNTPDAMLAGSARRRRPTVGDLEFTCRGVAEGEPDPLYDRIAKTVRLGGLFGERDADLPAEAVKGFKRWFGYCELVVHLVHNPTGTAFSVPVQIHRWDANGSNRGWIELMRTGPLDFGIWFLTAWKKRWGIKPDHRASSEGTLYDGQGKAVWVATELEAFQMAGLKYVEPHERDAFMAQVNSARARDQMYTRR
jgi:hypothetical protein